MKLSTRSRYGLRALVALERSDQDSMTSEAIATQEHISKKYMDEILGKLRRAEILATRRGAHGGYALNRSASGLTVLEVVESLDGPIHLAPCADAGYTCKRKDTCLSRPVWNRISEGIRSLMGQYTVAMVANGDCCVYEVVEAVPTADCASQA